jgi:hypothetical protein
MTLRKLRLFKRALGKIPAPPFALRRLKVAMLFPYQ